MITATSGILYSLGIEEDLGYAMYYQRHFLDPLLPGDGDASAVLEVQPPWCGERVDRWLWKHMQSYFQWRMRPRWTRMTGQMAIFRCWLRALVMCPTLARSRRMLDATKVRRT